MVVIAVVHVCCTWVGLFNCFPPMTACHGTLLPWRLDHRNEASKRKETGGRDVILLQVKTYLKNIFQAKQSYIYSRVHTV